MAQTVCRMNGDGPSGSACIIFRDGLALLFTSDERVTCDLLIEGSAPLPRARVVVVSGSRDRAMVM